MSNVVSEIQNELEAQKQRLFAAYERKLNAREQIAALEKQEVETNDEVTKLRMIIASLEFTVQKIKNSETQPTAEPAELV